MLSALLLYTNGGEIKYNYDGLNSFGVQVKGKRRQIKKIILFITPDKENTTFTCFLNIKT